MATSYVQYPQNGVPIYADASLLPSTALPGSLASVSDTNSLYSYDASIPGWIEIATPSGSSGITALSGDVSATGPGSVTATVNFVGGSSAASVHAAAVAVAAATSSNTPSTLVERDGSGNASFNDITVNESIIGVNGPGSIALITQSSSVQTTNATPTVVFQTGVSNNSINYFEVKVTAIYADGSDYQTFHKVASFYALSSSSPVIMAPGQSSLFATNTSTISVNIQTSGSMIQVVVTGASSEIINWKCSIVQHQHND